MGFFRATIIVMAQSLVFFVGCVHADEEAETVVLEALSRFSDAVVDEDVHAVLELVPESGIYDGDDHYSKMEIREELEDGSAYLHRSLFDQSSIECSSSDVPIPVSGKTYFMNLRDLSGVEINYNDQLDRFSVVVPKIDVSGCRIWLFFMDMKVEDGKAKFASYFFL